MKATFIVKVFLLSAGISSVIKLVAPYVEVSPSAGLAMTMVLMPVVILGIILGRRFLAWES